MIHRRWWVRPAQWTARHLYALAEALERLVHEHGIVEEDAR